MNIETKYHGSIEYEEKDIICFHKGLPGFTNLTKFILFPVKDNPIFNVLHSVEDSKIGLVVISPFEILKDYEFSLEEELINRLTIEEPEQVQVLNTVTLNSDIKKITTNLKAPIIINIKENLGEQIILDEDKYSIKHPLIKE